MQTSREGLYKKSISGPERTKLLFKIDLVIFKVRCPMSPVSMIGGYCAIYPKRGKSGDLARSLNSRFQKHRDPGRRILISECKYRLPISARHVDSAELQCRHDSRSLKKVNRRQRGRVISCLPFILQRQSTISLPQTHLRNTKC